MAFHKSFQLQFVSALILLIAVHSASASDQICPKSPPAQTWINELIGHLQPSENPVCREISLPCSLRDVKRVSEIVFVGETNHFVDEAKKTREALFELAKSGQIEVATELSRGAWPAYNWSKDARFDQLDIPDSPLIHPLDSPIYVAVGTAYVYRAASLRGVEDPNFYFQFFKSVSNNPLYRSAFEKIRTSRAHAKAVENIDQMLSIYEKAGHSGFSREQISRLNELIGQIPSETRKQLLDTMHRNIIDIARSEFLAEFRGINLKYLETLEDVEKLGIGTQNELVNPSPIHDILVLRRNREMASKIGAAACQMQGQRRKLVVIVGEKHIAGMNELMGCLFQKKVPIKQFQVPDKAQEDALRKTLNN